jgi:hypothetical protein
VREKCAKLVQKSLSQRLQLRQNLVSRHNLCHILSYYVATRHKLCRFVAKNVNNLVFGEYFVNFLDAGEAI